MEENNGEGEAPRRRGVEQKETTRGTTLVVAMFNSKKRPLAIVLVNGRRRQ
jgi:hypothetical protein